MTDVLASPEIRVLVAEDHELARSGLCACLGKSPELKIVGSVKNGSEAVQFVLANPIDIVLMDIRMPVLDGISATEQIKAKFPNTKIVMLTSHQEGEEVYAALAAGAEAYCLKDISMERLLEVVKMVADGAAWLDPAIAKMVLNSLPLNLSQKTRTTQNRQRYNTELTEREKEVLEKLVEGKSNREIADELSVTLHTVKAHVCSILQKLSVDDRTKAAIKALRDGIITNKSSYTAF